MKTILILGAGDLQLPAITTSRKMGLRTVALDGRTDAPGLRIADKSYVLDITSPTVCLDIAMKEKVDGVIHICSEAAMDAVGLINERMGFKGMNAAKARRAVHKGEMRRAFESGGAPNPRWIEASDEAGAIRAAKDIGRDIIIKPARNSGSRGVTRVEARAPENALREAFERAIGESRDPSVLIEEYVDGDEFSVEMLAWNGQPRVLAVTDKRTTGSPHFVETGHSQPSLFPEKAQRQIIDAALKGVEALELDWCAVHAEVKLSGKGPMIMEIGARLGGDFITTELVPRSTGVDMVRGAVRLALGEEPEISAEPGRGGAAIRYLQPKPGLVKSIHGIEEASGLPGVRVVHVSVKPGDIVPEMVSSLTRTGHVIAEGMDAAEAVACAEAARDTIRIETA